MATNLIVNLPSDFPLNFFISIFFYRILIFFSPAMFLFGGFLLFFLSWIFYYLFIVFVCFRLFLHQEENRKPLVCFFFYRH